MLRRYLTASVAAALVLLAPGVAHADSPTVVSRVGLPSNWSFSAGTTGCVDSNPQASVTHVTGPGNPPSGAGSLQLNAGAGSVASLDYDLSGDSAADALTSFSVHSYLPAVNTPVDSTMFIFMNDKNDANVSYQGRLSLPSEVAEWESTDLITSASTAWVSFNSETSTFTTIGTESYAMFLASYDVALDHLSINVDTCPLSGTAVAGHANLDDISLTYDSNTVVYDFEAPVATKLIGHVSPTTIPYQHAITPTATLTSEGSAFANQNVGLWAKAATAKTFSKVGTARSNAKGVVTAAAQHPKVNTSYQWRYPGDDTTFAPATSSTLTVHVGSKLSINAPAKVKKKKSFSVTGVMTPKHAGDHVTLFATKSGHTTKLATGKVHSDGSYSVTGKLKKKGHYTLVTTAAADSTNAKGSSPAKKLKVH